MWHIWLGWLDAIQERKIEILFRIRKCERYGEKPIPRLLTVMLRAKAYLGPKKDVKSVIPLAGRAG